MGTSVFDSELLKDAWSTEEMRGVFNDVARMQRWLDVEAALALLCKPKPMKISLIPPRVTTKRQERGRMPGSVVAC